MKLLRKEIRLSLRAKLTLLIESFVIVIVVITGIITTMREKETLENELTRRGLALASELAQFSVRPIINNDLPTLRRFIIYTMKQDYVLYAIVLDPHGRVLMHSDLAEVNKTYKDNLSLTAVNSNETGFTDIYLSKNEGQQKDIIDMFVPIAIAGVRLGTVRLGYSHMAVEKQMAKARQQILLIGLLTAASGGVVAFMLATFISAPIKRITNATEKVAHGNMNSQLTIKRNDEIGTLASAFNKMTEDLQKTTVSKDYFDNIIESMNDTLVVVSVDGKIKDINKATCELLEYSEDELVGRDIHLIIPEEEEILSSSGFLSILGQSTLVNREIKYLAKSGKRIPMLFSAAVLKSKEEKVEGVVCIARDITERKHIEEALRRSEGELRFLSSQLLKAQEEERRRLSIELHDELGQDLMVLKLKMRAIQERMHDESVSLKGECDEVISYINEVAENVRRISRDLSPSILEDLGLTAAIRWLVEAFSKHSNIESLLDMTDIDNLFSHEGQITIYRIIQECLTNVAKHSHATSAAISIKKMDEDVIFTIEDDGKGFHMQEAFMRDPGMKGLGLATMHERIRMLGGSIYIMSDEGTGTKIFFSIPLSVGVKEE
jgi:PAS domain S-box-containing protein